MSRVLDLIRGEHRSIAAILHGMQYLMAKTRSRGTRIDPAVFRAMLYYLDTYSDRMHHPKEDRYLFAAMRSRSREAGAIVEELEREHAGGAAALRDLEQALIRYEEGGSKEFPAFARAVEAFTSGYWDHMQKEEEKAFPLAEKVLSAEDWKEIDRAFDENRDPLADQRETQDFQKLFARIANLAPPPIGVGPPARD